MKRGIYAIMDVVALDVTGPLVLFRHEAAAIRFFSDVARAPNSQVGQAVKDYELRRLGWLDDETLQLEPEDQLILTGEKWASTQSEARET